MNAQDEYEQVFNTLFTGSHYWDTAVKAGRITQSRIDERERLACEIENELKTKKVIRKWQA